MKHELFVIPGECLNDPCNIPFCPGRYLPGHTYSDHDFKPVQSCGKRRHDTELYNALRYIKLDCDGVSLPCK